LISIRVTELVIHCHETTFYRVLTAQRCRLSSMGPAVLPLVIGDQPKAAMRVADLGSRSLQMVYMVINIVLGPCCTAAAHYSPEKTQFNPTPLSELPTPVRLSSCPLTRHNSSCPNRLFQTVQYRQMLPFLLYLICST